MTAEATLLQQIEPSLDSIVELAEKCITEAHAVASDLESQLRNLQNLVTATDSVPVLKNFIGYQMGRGKIPAKVGRRILKDVQRLSQMKDVQRLSQKAEELTQRSPEEARRWAQMELIRLYMGFLVRKFVAERKRKG